MFGKRRTRSTGFEWQLPGGWIEPGESPQQAARREVLEETGLHLDTPHFVGLTSNVFPGNKHSISLYFEAECLDVALLQVGETDKCSAWEWKYWSQLNSGLYLPLKLFKSTEYQPFLKDQHQTYVSI